MSEDGNDNACHGCSEPGELLECNACLLSWHRDCLQPAALAQYKGGITAVCTAVVLECTV